MLSTDIHAARRKRLLSEVGGPILLLGCGERARNLPMTTLPFRQDSTFLYLTGCSTPNAALLMDEQGETLFLPPPEPDDALWHGVGPGLAAQGEMLGFGTVEPSTHLALRAQGLSSPKVLAIPDENRNRTLGSWTDRTLRFGREHGDLELVDAIIRMRRVKQQPEIDEIRKAAALAAKAHHAVMTATRPGATERALAALYEAVVASHWGTLPYPTILSVRGEVLHNFHHPNTLEAGQILLIDSGAEVNTGYGVDITRSYPVSGRYSPRQRAAYEAVLEAQLASIACCRPGVRYREVHDTSCRILAQWLADEGLLTCSVDTAIETGAHAVFFPHGCGHLLGLDVHDLENFGDRPSYPADQARPDQFGTAFLRLDLPLEPGWVVTVEPGFYVVPAILSDATLVERLQTHVDFAKAREWTGFGGIRIEDDILITENEPENLTTAVPKGIHDIEALVNTGPSVQDRLC